jgi:hypothetical protein
MNVFISWSGDQGKAIAADFKQLLITTLQYTKPYFSNSDMEKGSRWSEEISRALADSQFGIFCMTKDSIKSDWMLFEAGAISKHVDKSRVCPVLLGVESSDISAPFAQFQITKFNKTEIKTLFLSINSNAGSEAVSQKVLDSLFDIMWGEFEKKILLSLENNEGPQPKRDNDEIISEILENTRRLVLDRRNNSIDPEAITYLLTSLIKFHNQEEVGAGGYQETLDRLKTISRPVRYIANKFKDNRGVMEVLREYDALKYKHDGAIEFPDEEDDFIDQS